jgi:hypothetical protein
MKRLAVIALFLASLGAAPAGAGEVPHAVAGFILGRDIADYNSRIQRESVLPIRYRDYLEEVEIAPLPGFKSGLITYGTCTGPGRIIRIKLKYADASRAFYDALLERVQRRFGKATSYEGDPFHIVIDWKWSFVDDAGNRVILHLSHNSRDAEEKFGNAVKLTLVSALEEERRCFQKKYPSSEASQKNRPKPLHAMTPEDWDSLVPQ